MPLQRARFRISQYNQKHKHDVKKKERMIRQVSLSLTSMVDMFAILVIFLLTNTSTVEQWLEVGHDIDLPKAKSTELPQKGATLHVNGEAVFADDKPLVSVKEIESTNYIIDKIQDYLKKLELKKDKKDKKDNYINIVGDTHLPFGVIRKIIASCQEAGFRNINLAVQPY